MAEENVVALLPEPDDARDEQIFKQWKTGKKSIPALARDYNLTQSHVGAIIDQQLPQLTPKAHVRALRHLLCDLEELRQAFHDIAMTASDSEAAHVTVRVAHEIAKAAPADAPLPSALHLAARFVSKIARLRSFNEQITLRKFETAGFASEDIDAKSSICGWRLSAGGT
jgi:hypothetical protein